VVRVGIADHFGWAVSASASASLDALATDLPGPIAAGWAVHFYDAKTVRAHAAELLGDDTAVVLDDPRAALGPPWTQDHRIALAATVRAG
jgi:hypothetical protein